MKNIELREQLLTKIVFEKFVFKILYFLNTCPVFVGSVHNFGRSDLIKKSWKDSNRFGFRYNASRPQHKKLS